MASTELKPIIFYDIACVTPGRPWSPMTMKTRYCLGYKRLPFMTVCVELPDITGLLLSKGITQPPYTLPAIEDPNTGAFVMESLAIATYLDDTYPETPKVLNPAVPTLLKEVENVFSLGSGGAPGSKTKTSTNPGNDVAPRLVFVMLGTQRLNPPSEAYYHRTRSASLGERWTALRDACSGDSESRSERVVQGIEAIRGPWREVAAMYDREGEDGKSSGPFVLGKEPCFLDFAIAGRVRFILDGLLPSEVEMLTHLEGDRLVKLVESLEKYNIC